MPLVAIVNSHLFSPGSQRILTLLKAGIVIMAGLHWRLFRNFMEWRCIAETERWLVVFSSIRNTSYAILHSRRIRVASAGGNVFASCFTSSADQSKL